MLPRQPAFRYNSVKVEYVRVHPVSQCYTCYTAEGLQMQRLVHAPCSGEQGT